MAVNDGAANDLLRGRVLCAHGEYRLVANVSFSVYKGALAIRLSDKREKRTMRANVASVDCSCS